MTLSDLSGLYSGLTQAKALVKELAEKRSGNVFLQGLRASAARPSLVRSDPKGKKHQSFSSVAEVLMLSKY